MFFNGLFILEKGYTTELIQFTREDGSLIAGLRFWDFILSTSLDIMFPLASVAFVPPSVADCFVQVPKRYKFK